MTRIVLVSKKAEELVVGDAIMNQLQPYDPNELMTFEHIVDFVEVETVDPSLWTFPRMVHIIYDNNCRSVKLKVDDYVIVREIA